MLQLKIECHRDDVEQLNMILEETNALSITLTDKEDDPILEPELGTTPLWPHVVVEALYEKQEFAEQAILLLSLHYPKSNASVHALPDQDWVRNCLHDFKPLQFGQRLWICPSWLTPPDPGAVNLILDPGLAFGTGSHATTSLCLAWLDQASLKDKRLVDYGCGSGILALAAIKLGVQHAYAVDLDEQALYATQQNAKNNQISAEQFRTQS